ncbi:competence type IV pilus minor pilin ComGG [Streptococcus lactarius]|uniref:competence type IV pilus minor pilin ComGG n=1 Tax=Streptococcus lactarius TaxID=684066 RepID=UPI00360D1404
MAAVFSLLLQFYLHRQVAERRILKSSEDRLRAYALVQLAMGQETKEEKTADIHLKSGTVHLKWDAGFLYAKAEIHQESYDFVLPVSEEKRARKRKREEREEGKEVQERKSDARSTF